MLLVGSGGGGGGVSGWLEGGPWREGWGMPGAPSRVAPQGKSRRLQSHLVFLSTPHWRGCGVDDDDHHHHDDDDEGLVPVQILDRNL